LFPCNLLVSICPPGALGLLDQRCTLKKDKL
jgi:hypothetical protein